MDPKDFKEFFNKNLTKILETDNHLKVEEGIIKNWASGEWAPMSPYCREYFVNEFSKLLNFKKNNKVSFSKKKKTSEIDKLVKSILQEVGVG